MNFETFHQDLAVFIAYDGKHLLTDSRAVALAFGKKHNYVLRAIDAMRSSRWQVIAEDALLKFSAVVVPERARQEATHVPHDGHGPVRVGIQRRRRPRSAHPVSQRLRGSHRPARLGCAERSLVQQLHALERLRPRLLSN